MNFYQMHWTTLLAWQYLQQLLENLLSSILHTYIFFVLAVRIVLESHNQNFVSKLH